MDFREFQKFYDESKKCNSLNKFIQNLGWSPWMDDIYKRKGEHELERFVSSLYNSIKGDIYSLSNYSGMSKTSFKNYYEYDLTDLKPNFQKTLEYKYLVYIVFIENVLNDYSTQDIYVGKIDRIKLENFLKN